MKERPILFSDPMVRALLSGQKTQTRRAMNPQPDMTPEWDSERQIAEFYCADECVATRTCPYGQPGDRLAVREGFYAFGRWETRFSQKKGRDEWHFIDMTLECGHSYSYTPDGNHPVPMGGRRNAGVTPAWWRRPSIFMPRAACRLMLEIVGVRVERLQEISEADALAEGVHRDDDYPTTSACPSCAGEGTYEALAPSLGVMEVDCNECATARQRFMHLWQSINGAESWAANPWCWVIEFRRVQP